MKPSLRLWGTSLLLLSVFFFNSALVVAATRTAVVDGGDWGAPATWGGTLPGNGDEIIIPAPITVTVTNSYSYTGSTYVRISGILSFGRVGNTTGRIELDEGGKVDVYQGGTITATITNSSAWFTIKSNGQDVEVYRSSGGSIASKPGPWFCTTDGCNVSLPITLLSFSTHYQPAQGRVRLEWITASEINNDYFTIERSADAERFEGIEQVRGAGNSKEQRAYTTYDESPLPGLSYYRLRQTDFDGASTVSKLMAVHNTGTQGQFGFEVAPNPFDGQNLNLLLSGETAGPASVTVFGSLGQKYYDHLQPIESGQLSLRLNQPLAGGVYWVKVSQAGQTATQAVLVRH